MNKVEATEAIFEAKQTKGMSWEQIAQGTGLSKEFTTSACLGMNSLSEEYANALCETLGLGTDVAASLQEFPYKTWDKTIPTDPVVYRFYEMIGVYGETIKELIHEDFGDGIMSAIDFSMDISKQEDPKGDRVVITLNGKFLPYKSW
jgi:cyanate lyase